jgi:hypothetical protein
LELLHNIISKACSKIHTNRLSSLFQIIDALLCCNKLTLVQLGRSLPGDALVKNKIKKSDRLIGNSHLNRERKMIYQALLHLLISPFSRPIILIDWSGVTHCGAFHMIRASIPFKGRALTIYEEVYPEHLKDSPKANRTFLRNLADILPEGCRCIIVTDAGFRNPWFKEVLKLGWDFVGRVRNKTHVQARGGNEWRQCKTLYQKATSKAKSLGEYLLAKSNPIICQLYLMKGKKQYRKKRNLKGHKVRCSSSLKHAKRNKEPWLIATSLSEASALKVMKIYKLRMCIEQGFRDIKNQRYGFCLRETRSGMVERLSNLLLVGALATFIVCIYGQATQLLNIDRQYQTNSIKNRVVLSWFFLGITAIKQKIKLSWRLIHFILKERIVNEVYYA